MDGRPDKLHADKGYDYDKCRKALRERGIQGRIARRGVESSERLGRHRWVVERTHAWIAGFGKLRIRFERQLDTHLALLKLACSITCLRFVEIFLLTTLNSRIFKKYYFSFVIFFKDPVFSNNPKIPIFSYYFFGEIFYEFCVATYLDEISV